MISLLISLIGGWGISCETASRWMSMDFRMIDQHWVRKWLGAVRQQAITWNNVDPDLRRHMEIILYVLAIPLWHHQMEIFSALLALCVGNSPMNSPQKDRWRGTLMFSLICVWINAWENNREAGDLRRHRTHYDVIVMSCILSNTTI